MIPEKREGRRLITKAIASFKGLEQLYDTENNKRYRLEKEELCSLLESRGIDSANTRKSLSEAYWYHFAQKRLTGEHYISHPVSVAIKLAENFYISNDELEGHVQIAIAHDLPEKTAITRDELKTHTNHPWINHGVLLLSRTFHSERSTKESRKENFARILASADLPTIRVKIADWEHNLETTPRPIFNLSPKNRGKANRLVGKFADTSKFILPLIRALPKEAEREYLYGRINKVHSKNKPFGAPDLEPLGLIA